MFLYNLLGELSAQRNGATIVWVSMNASHVFMTAYKNKLFCNIWKHFFTACNKMPYKNRLYLLLMFVLKMQYYISRSIHRNAAGADAKHLLQMRIGKHRVGITVGNELAAL